MALTYDQINSFCQTLVIPKIINNIYLSSALAYRLLRKPKKWTGGPKYEVPISFAKNTNAEAYAGTTQLTVAQVEEVTKTSFSPRQYNVAVKLTGIELAENQGGPKVLNLVKEKMQLAESSLKDLFGTDIIADQAGVKLDGFGLIMKATGSTYGDLAPADVTTWESSSGSAGKYGGPDSSTTSLTKLVLQKHYNSCKVDNDKPTLLVTTDDIFAGIESTIIMPLMRYSDPKMAQLGFDNFKYKSCVVITDSHVAAGDLYMLNENHLYFAVFPNMNFKFIPFSKGIPHDYDFQVAHIRWYGNLICDQRWSCGWMSAITGVA